jgi:ParB family chromosome partitioning protein
MATKRPSLGRGLEALLGSPALLDADPAEDADTPTMPARSPRDHELANLPVDLLQRGRYQPRVDMRPESLQELADSIRAQGVVQPIVVRPLTVTQAMEPVRYEIIAGERRWRAAQMAGLHEIPAIIRRVPDDAAIAMSLIENIQRENLNPLEEARALDRLIREFEMTHQSAADAVGRSRAAVSNLLRLLELAEEVKALVEQRQIEMGHARALLGLAAGRQQIEVAALVAKKGLSVRETEALVRRLVDGVSETPPRSEPRIDPNIRKLEQDLADKLGAKVLLQHAASGRGKLVINYNSLDELDGILGHIQ